MSDNNEAAEHTMNLRERIRQLDQDRDEVYGALETQTKECLTLVAERDAREAKIAIYEDHIRYLDAELAARWTNEDVRWIAERARLGFDFSTGKTFDECIELALRERRADR